MILTLAGRVYGAAASWRRRAYRERPDRVHRLRQPVISVGNLTAGGSGKTPIVEYLARLLLAHGERPAILTRGYARQAPQDGVTVVSDGTRVLAALDAAGDEPLMLARALPGVPVLVGADRYLSGRLAETRFGTTVHLLDDGFQHVALARTIDLLLVDARDLHDQVIPAGRLREPLAAAAVADALLVAASVAPPLGPPLDPTAGNHVDIHAADAVAADEVARTLGVATAFTIRRQVAAPPSDLAGVPVLAVAGIARPERFFADLAASGWLVAATLAFRDHHPFAVRDVTRIAAAATRAGAAVVVTTGKDAVRLEACGGREWALRAVPLQVSVEPAEAFRAWLLERLDAATARRARPYTAAGSSAGWPRTEAGRTCDGAPGRPGPVAP